MKTENANKTVNELAREIEGDGKRPNKYFVTIGYGWYMPYDENNEGDGIQAENSLDAVTILAEDRAQALVIFNAISVNSNVAKVTGQTIGQVTIEDRLTGTVIEKRLSTTRKGRFFVDQF